jgi:hypothetical protein
VHDRRRLARRKVAILCGEPDDSGADQRERDEEAVWLRQHRAEILAIAAAALEYTDLADDEAAEWLAEVARDLREDVVSPARCSSCVSRSSASPPARLSVSWTTPTRCSRP